MPYRAIATDLDGTLLRSDGSVSPRTRAAIDAVEDAGWLVVIATGRPPRWIPPVVEQLGERGLVVCANGASIYDPARHELVARNDLSVDVAGALVDELQAALPEATLGFEQGMRFVADTAIERADPRMLKLWLEAGLQIGPIGEFLTEGVTKLIVRLPDDAPAGSAARVQELVGDRALVTHSTNETFLELSRADVHKASTVELLLESSGIDAAEVVAFGDMPNDRELVEWAGWGVAMGNGHPELQAVADEVTASNDEDGVAVVLERLLEGA